jgi:polysaccharide biosynthesis protein PelC
MKRILISVMGLIMLAGCATANRSNTPGLEKKVKWALLPMENNTETPQAALRMEAITETLLRIKGAASLEKYPANLTQGGLFEPADAKTVETSLNWAKQSGARYGVTGSVNEWRYKTGVDGEPAVGLTLKVLDLQNRQVVWSAAGARTGWGREAVSAVAQKLLEELTDGLDIK